MVGNHQIDRMDEYLYLGTIIHKKLNFTGDTANIIRKSWENEICDQATSQSTCKFISNPAG